MKTFGTKLADTSNNVSRLERRIKELESITSRLAEKLESESTERRTFEHGAVTKQTGSSSQITALKESIEELGNLFETNMLAFKKEITQQTDEKNAKIVSYIDEKIKLFDYYDKKSADDDFTHRNFESDFKSRMVSLENEVKTSIKEMKEEINSAVARVEFLEKKTNDNYGIIKTEIQTLNDELIGLKNETTIFRNFKENTVANFKSVHEDILHQEEVMTNFTNKINYIINDFENKTKDYENSYKAQMENFGGIKDEISKRIEIIDNKVTAKFKELSDTFIKQATYQSNELDNFEQHVLGEQAKFAKYIGSRYDEQNENMKKLFDYVNEDLNILSNKTKALDEHLNKVKQQFFNSLNECEEFLTKKYEGLFRMITYSANSNHTIPINKQPSPSSALQ